MNTPWCLYTFFFKAVTWLLRTSFNDLVLSGVLKFDSCFLTSLIGHKNQSVLLSYRDDLFDSNLYHSLFNIYFVTLDTSFFFPENFDLQRGKDLLPMKPFQQITNGLGALEGESQERGFQRIHAGRRSTLSQGGIAL